MRKSVVKMVYTEGYLNPAVVFAITYVFDKLKLDLEIIDGSGLAEELDKYIEEYDDFSERLKEYKKEVFDNFENKNSNKIETQNEIYGSIHTSENVNEKFDFDHAQYVVKRIFLHLSLLLLKQGIPQKKVFDELLEVKMFTEFYDLNDLLYIHRVALKMYRKEECKKFIKKIISEMPEGKRKEYAQYIDPPVWMEEALEDNDIVTEEWVREQLNKITDWAFDSAKLFKSFGFAGFHMKDLFPSTVTLKNSDEEEKE